MYFECILVAYISEMQTGKGGENIRIGRMLHGFYFKDICFKCSFAVIVRNFLKIFV